MRVISLGWGVQSFGLAAMSALGELPPVDVAIHADTTHERSETYAFAAKWTPWLEERGVRVVTVRMENTDVRRSWDNTPGLMIPAFTTYTDGKPSGMVRRQCTREWKVRPIRQWLQANRNGATVEQWIGITLDEWTRMRDSDVQYIQNHYPFMEMDPPWRRGRVMRWLNERGLEIPPKSRCVFCPFQTDDDWRETKASATNDPLDDWERALTADLLIRNHRPGFVAYLHAACKPLAKVDLRNEQDHGQLELWGEECTGNCFL